MKKSVIAGTFLTILMAFPLVNAAESGPNNTWVPGTTIPIIQLTGQTLQYYAYGVYYTTPTNSLTLQNYGMEGADLGKPVIFSDKIVIPNGDTDSTYEVIQGTSTLYYKYRSGATDSIGYFTPMDLSQCNAIPSLDQQLAASSPNPAPDYSNCPTLKLFTDPTADPTLEPTFKQTSISGLGPLQGVGGDEVPSGAFTLSNNDLYMFYIVQVETAPNGGHFSLDTILAKSDQTESSWSAAVAPTFTKLYDASAHPVIADPSNPPDDTTGPGKFIVAAPVIMSHATLAANNFLQGLPPSLQNAANVIFLFGSSWYFNKSNLYLAVMDAGQIEAGPSQWFYASGFSGLLPTWSGNESDAAPLFSTWQNGCTPGSSDPSCKPDIGHHTVVWNATLRQFILMYGRTTETAGNIAARTAPAPWGPWSQEASIFDNSNPWNPKFVHHSGDPIIHPVDPIHKQDGTLLPPDGNSGKAYGPGLIDQYTQNSDGSVTSYFVMSAWPPYDIFLMKTNFKATGAPTTTTVSTGDLSLIRVYPNPWRSDQHTGINVTFDQLSPGSTVKLFTVSGRWIRTLAAPNGSVEWDLHNDSGNSVASGYYLYLVTTGGSKTTGKIMVIR